jgi:hypothetical protein
MKKKFNTAVIKSGCGLLVGMLAPSVVHACACGCGVFDVGGNSMLPNGPGGMAYLQYDYQDQDQNWSGSSKAPDYNNGDKQIQTDFLFSGVQYMVDSSWGFSLEMPFEYRTFKSVTSNPNVPPNTVTTLNWGALGDMRIKGIYTGFFNDMSLGVTFGFKLPTGDWTYNNAYNDVDRDSEIGTGSTDILLGSFYRGNITEDQKWDWFAQGQLDVPMLTQAEYRPGVELDTAAGIDYKGWSIGRVRISPVAQAIFSYRSSDSGANASGGANDNDGPIPGPDSGYERLLLSPGVEFHIHPVKIYADAEFPIYQNFTGNQLAASVLYKLNVSVMF